MGHNTISAVIITKNEERNIERCIRSLEGIVDEIIVIDDFSDDRTVEICRSLGVEPLSRRFVDYSDAKNFGNAQATGDWILSIDADEALSEQLRASILEIKVAPKATAYSMNRLTNYCDQWIRYSGWYPDRKIRIWKKGLGKWQGKIHETVVIEDNEIQWLPGDLLHYSFPDMDVHIRKIHYFADQVSQDLFRRGKRYSAFMLILGPWFEFFKKYILQRGFLDGYYGFVIAKMAACYQFYKYAKLRELWKAKSQEKY